MNPIMLKFVAFMVACSIAASGPAAAQAKGESQTAAENRGALRLPGIEINVGEKYVDVDGSVCLRTGLLELVACTKGSKEHESIVAITARPTHVHAALLLLGADAGHPAMMKLADEQEDRWIPVPPRGTPVDAYLVFKDDNGQMIERPVTDFIARRELDENGTLVKRAAFPTHTFIFAGSRLVGAKRGNSRYLCDQTGNVISIVTFGDELLCLAEAQEESNGPSPWEVDATHLPQVGSPITLRLRPRVGPARDAPQQAKPSLQLGAPFSHNGVLQRGLPAPVWGWSTPGISIRVEFAGQTKTTVAGADGKWMLELDPLQASFAPRQMVVTSGTEERAIIKNLLVGEVWLASGQSNMQWKVRKSSCSGLHVEAKGTVAPIREFEVTSAVAMLHPIERAEGAWKDGNYDDYSAIAFAFAHKLYGELNVPVGILNCSFSQTAIQAWVPRVGFRDGTDDYTKAIYEKILQTDPTTPQHKAAWGDFYRGVERTLARNTERVKSGEPPRAVTAKPPGNMNGNRDAPWLFNGRMNPVVPYALRGAIWNQGYANSGEGLPYYENLHSLARGWRLRWGRPELPIYFHQFYCPRTPAVGRPSIDSTAEMRLGTWLARDIPGTGMASQIDITGSIHYWNKAVPGQRLALHALKNQYGKKVVADGPMFKSYEIDGDKLIVSFTHAEGGLVVAETGSNADRRNKQGTGFADPKVIVDGESRVKLFYLADQDRVWHPAAVKIDGDKVVLTSPAVPSPRGVSYGSGGVGFQPNLYNRALLPMTPFIHYDHELVTSATWPDAELKISGAVADPKAAGKKYEWRKMPLLSTQFRDNAVLQAGVPITFWGSALHDHGYEAEGDAIIKFSFAGIEKTIPLKSDPAIVSLGPGQSRFHEGKEWLAGWPDLESGVST